jgi:hypothetical protein
MPESECETWLAPICRLASWPGEDCALLEVDDETMLLVEALDVVDKDVMVLVEAIGIIVSVVDDVALLGVVVDVVDRADVVFSPPGETTPK